MCFISNFINFLLGCSSVAYGYGYRDQCGNDIYGAEINAVLLLLYRKPTFPGCSDPEGSEALPARGGEGPRAQHQPLQARPRRRELRRGRDPARTHRDTPQDTDGEDTAGHRHAQ